MHDTVTHFVQFRDVSGLTREGGRYGVDGIAPLNPRSLLAGLLGNAIASPMAQALAQRDVDVAIVGAGAAGIAAARVLVRAGLSALVVEASGRIGGRCFTDRVTLAAPFDHGAHWLHAADHNPLVKLGRDLDFPLYPDERRELIVAPGHAVGEDEARVYQQMVETTEALLIAAAERGEDVATALSLPRDLGRLREAISFRLGPFDLGKGLSDVSGLDFARARLGTDLLNRAGLGTLIATLGRGLPLALSAPVYAITAGKDGVKLVTAQGELGARAAIVTAPSDIIAQGRIAFTPALDDEHKTAFQALKLGDFLHVGCQIAPEAVAIEADTHVFSLIKDERTFAALARAGGSDVWYVSTGGIFARELEAAGEDAAFEFATEWLAAHFGANLRTAIRKQVTTFWGKKPFIGGAWSVAAPGQARARAILREPHAERVLFAGEAAHDALWGTVGGAWESGQAAAMRAIDIVRG